MHKANKLALAATIASCIALQGCVANQNRGDDTAQAVGAGGVGILVGLLTGKWYWGVLSAVGAWAAIELVGQMQQTRTAEQDQEFYGAGPVTSPQVVIRNTQVDKKTLKPGERVQVVSDYSVQLPAGMQSAEVTSDWVLTKDGEELFVSKPQTETLPGGGYQLKAGVPIPKDAEPGTYVLESRVNIGTSRSADVVTFTVLA